MIHCKALLTVSVSTNEITSTGKNQLIQYPELTYLAIIASQQDWKIHLHWVNHVWTDRIGIEPIIAVLETAVLPIKLSTYKVMGNRTPTYGVKVRCSTVELLPDKITAFGIEPKPISHSLIILPLKLYSTLENHYERKRSPGNSTPRRKLPLGLEPKTCWFVINCSIHLSYGSISRFLYFDSGWGVRKNIYLRTAKLRNSRCRSRTDYFKIMTLAWYSVPLICKRRMKDSNLQVVSDRMVSNHLQYHYGNTAYLAVCQTAINIKLKKSYSLSLSVSPQRYWVEFHL